MEPAKNSKCQSCGMPLSKDENGGGTNKDKSKSIYYCSHCYKDGKFTNPDITAEEMKLLVRQKLVSKRIPGFLAKGIPKLKRWKNK